MNKNFLIVFFVFIVFLAGSLPGAASDKGKPVHHDVPFLQDYSIKYYFNQPGGALQKVAADRNGKIQVLSSEGLLHPHAGEFLYPGTLEKDGTYRPMADKNIVGLATYKQQLVYLDDEAVLANAWSGELFSKHEMPGAKLFAGGKDFTFLVSDGKQLKYIKDSKQLWKGKLQQQAIDIKYAKETKSFWILTSRSLHTFSAEKEELKTVFEGSGFTSFDVVAFGTKTIIGTPNGYIEINNLSQKQEGQIKLKLPVTEITVVKEVNGNVWFGSPDGAFMLRDDGKFNYYYGERWLPGNRVTDIAAGPDNSVLVLTDKGLGRICFKEITLYKKALYFEDQVRHRHIRHGFNAELSGMENGNLSTGHLDDSDNDGLWTSMYLGSQVFRYAVTKSEEALQNTIESLDAMERLYTVNPVPGFPSRSFNRSGYIEKLSNPERWQHSSDPEWDWKATTSSDEAIGHVFVFGAIAELIDVEPVRAKAVQLLDALMQHIVDNDFYLVDYDGKPTTWGRWNPEYVNGFPTSVGDRKLNSSNIVAMLQTAYHFTKKEIYKEKAFELMHDYGYLENLMRPMEEIGKAPDGSDDWAEMLSESWNHSDDEMYFLGYWGLYRYAFNDTLKEMYAKSIIDHWEHERPEKDGLWNLFTGLVSNEFDLKEAIWYLQEYPMDLINWTVKNSHRKDIQPVSENFRRQTIEEVLPPDELPVRRHNANRFGLDAGGEGRSENSAGDIWLLPYWLGRYLEVIE
ncbi:hypothetical protein SAMN05444280_110119 [Tangfeifania diversioriginum]|uniref:Uncharacterized protein n=1 Tax=Tangfeifania diversioriginum TaxID=1168035 RepID=A0A1M6GCQ0_9BACT|nr:hypothetical protein [Tangfeifania diversioriginum]SHJ07723.1 hypothetical protein SAMN05444280_110119 [Tangfeifania diversioriginum]